jgi:cardiolipin synthase
MAPVPAGCCGLYGGESGPAQNRRTQHVIELLTCHLPSPAFILALAWPWVSFSSALHLTIFLMVSFHCLRERRQPTSTLLWLFLTFSFPIIGALLYVAVGINRIPAKAWRKHVADEVMKQKRETILRHESPAVVYWRAVHGRSAEPPADHRITSLNSAMDSALNEYPLLAGNRTRLLINGDEAYPAMLEAIRNARNHIHLQSFIIGRDRTGREFLDLLQEKARAGVQVRVLFDRFGSTMSVLTGFFRKYRGTPNMQLVGWTQANPIKRQFQVNLRNHRKALIVDGTVAFTGGINIGNDNLTSHNRDAIRDYHFELAGPIVQELQYSFLRDWYFMTDENPDILLHANHFPEAKESGKAYARVINSGPTTSEIGIISDVFFASIVSARHQIQAVTPYFVPSRDILQALRSAAMRGVRVQLVVPAKSNHAYAGLAGRALYEELLRTGVEIYERAAPFMHAKALIVDDILAIVGTANLDERSLRLNYETNLAVYSEDFVYQLGRAVAHEIENSTRLDLSTWSARPLRQRLLENFCNLLTPIL